MLRWTPQFDVGVDGVESVFLSYPVQVFVHGGRTAGTHRRTATGIPHTAITQRYRTIGLTLRFIEAEWEAVRRMLVWGQTGASFGWHPNDIPYANDIEDVVEVYLDSPRVRDGFRPERDPQIPWLMRLSIVLCRADGEPWALEYFKQPLPFTATGGTIVDAGGYRSHIFTANGTFEVTIGSSEDVEVLLVGGGGKGGDSGTTFARYTGGGGGGRVRHLTGQTLVVGVYPVVVGAGQTSSVLARGESSTFNGETAEGGGRGAGSVTDGQGGGSGGGGLSASGFTRPNGNAIYGAMGNNGGVGNAASTNGGGGGGATQAGGSATTTAKGGDGYTTDISGVPATYGGGGGGRNGAGGAGGGGAGTSNGGTAGTPNTGGGGGGTQYSIGVGAPGGNGGSGIVIIRYPLL